MTYGGSAGSRYKRISKPLYRMLDANGDLESIDCRRHPAKAPNGGNG